MKLLLAGVKLLLAGVQLLLAGVVGRWAVAVSRCEVADIRCAVVVSACAVDLHVPGEDSQTASQPYGLVEEGGRVYVVQHRGHQHLTGSRCTVQLVCTEQ